MHGGRRFCTVFCVTSIVSLKSSVNIAVPSWFTTVVSKVWGFIRVAFKWNYVWRKTSGYYFFSGFRLIISSKTSVNISVAS